jgi:hypothetical protein
MSTVFWYCSSQSFASRRWTEDDESTENITESTPITRLASMISIWSAQGSKMEKSFQKIHS